MQRWHATEQRAVQAEADKANAELSFLKAQINPHFLFNTLNNFYSLAMSGSDHTAASIMKLSNIMRYVTDDVMEDYVTLHAAGAGRSFERLTGGRHRYVHPAAAARPVDSTLPGLPGWKSLRAIQPFIGLLFGVLR